MLSTRSAGEPHKETIMSPLTTSGGLRGLIATAIFGTVGLGLCVVADADPGAESRTVKFADLNISDPAGAHVLYTRIRVAAQVVCSHYFLLTDTDKTRCVRDVTADAVAEINQPALSAVYNANNKTSVPSGVVSQSR
jgi:UrcA family protein